MPISVVISGMPSQTTSGQAAELKRLIKNTVADIPELLIDESAVWVALPRDFNEQDLSGKEFFVTVHGLLSKPKRTPAVRDHLAKALAKTVRMFATTSYGVKYCYPTVVLDPPWDENMGGYTGST